MSIRKFAFIGGLVMFVMGALAFIPILSGGYESLAPLKVTTSYGLFLGFFAMNIFNKLALLAFGVAGILASRAESLNVPIGFARTVAIVMGVLALFGFVPGLSTLYGYWPLFGGEIILHGIFAVLGTHYGYTVPARLHVASSSATSHA